MKIKNKKFYKLAYLVLAFLICPQFVYGQNSDIVISEIASFETSDYEWLEISNISNSPLDISGWKFYENETNHGLSAWQGDLIIEPEEFAIIANKPDKFLEKNPTFSGTIIDSAWSSLTEAGEEIGLKDSNGEIMEIFTYLQTAGTSLQKIDLRLADYSATNWQAHATSHSAGLANEFPADVVDDDQEGGIEPDNETDEEPELEDTEDEQIAEPHSILINEFVSDPVSGEKEWIEAYNTNAFDVDLTGWKILDGSNVPITLEGVITANGFFVLELNSAKLNNSGDVITLKNQTAETIDSLTYGLWEGLSLGAPTATDPDSVARISDGYFTDNPAADFSLTQTPTKGSPNNISHETTEITEETDAEQEKPVKVIPAPITGPSYKDLIIINEIFPNPAGSDTELEFIELRNISEKTVDLTNWQLEDNSKIKFTFNKNSSNRLTILPREYLAISRQQSGLALNNDKDEIKLFSPDHKTQDSIKYQEDPLLNINSSYALTSEKEWSWTSSITKGASNVFIAMNHPPIINYSCPTTGMVNEEIICDASDSYDPENNKLSFVWKVNAKEYRGDYIWFNLDRPETYAIKLIVSDSVYQAEKNFKIKITGGAKDEKETTTKKKTVTTALKSKTTTSAKTPTGFQTIELANIRSLKTNSKVQTSGVISVLPNTFNKSTAYLAGSGIQIYLNKANWPDLALGDLVQVSGTLSQAYGETRLKLSDEKSIIVLEPGEAPQPQAITINQISEELEGYLVQFSGQLLERKSNKLTIIAEDAQATVVIKPNTKIALPNLINGETLTIIGIVSQYNDVYQILPRSQADIIKNNPTPTASQNQILPAEKKSQSTLSYLIIGVAFLMLTLGIVFYQNKKSSQRLEK